MEYCDKRLLNILCLSTGFVILFVGFRTTVYTERVVLETLDYDVRYGKPDFYISLGILFGVASLCVWISPWIVTKLGPRVSMALGSLSCVIYVTSFLYPRIYCVYPASAIMGFGGALLWTGQGRYLLQNSDYMTVVRNASLFYTMFQMCFPFGNAVFFYIFRDETYIKEKSRLLMTSILTAVSCVGLIIIIVLRPASMPKDSYQVTAARKSRTFQDCCSVCRSKYMLLFWPTMINSGLMMAFHSAVYGTCIVFTNAFGDDTIDLLGLSGVFAGMGEIFGGMIFGLTGLFVKKPPWNLSVVVLFGFFIDLMALISIGINLPNPSPYEYTHEESVITPRIELAITCSFLLGFGEACYNTQIITLLGRVFVDNKIVAFSIYKSLQCAFGAIAFFYSNYIGLYCQLLILLFTNIFGTFSFVIIEAKSKHRDQEAE